MKAAILGLGQWLPETIRENSAWPGGFSGLAAASTDRELADAPPLSPDDRLDAIVARHIAPELSDPFLGSVRRRVADESISACEAEAGAARAAIEDAGIDAKDIDVVLSWAVVPDWPSPPSAPKVAQLVGATGAMGFGVDAACATILGQLLMAAALIESGRARHVLITGSHLVARAFRLLHPASPSVGDAATAVVVGPSERSGILAVHGASHGEFYDAVCWRRAKDVPWYRQGGEMYMGTYDPEAARRLVHDTLRFGVQTVRQAADRAGVAVDSIDMLACVQPRKWIPAALAEGLGLSPEVAPQTYEELGHLGACGVVTNLIEGRRRGLLSRRKPATVCMYAQGAGFTRAAAIVRWSE